MRIDQAYRGGHPDSMAPGWWIHFPYDEDTIERLKAAVPHTHRVWDAELHRWWTDDLYMDRVQGIIPSIEAYLNQPRLL